MLEHHTLRWIFAKLDQSLLKSTYAQKEGYYLKIEQEGEVTRIQSGARGFSESFGARRLALLAAVFFLIAIFIPLMLAGVFAFERDMVTPLILASAGVVVLMIGTLAWLAFHWAKKAASEETLIECSPQSVRVRRLFPKGDDLVVPIDSIKEVSITDQFFVSLELLIITHEFKIHRVVSGLQHHELQDVASVIEHYRR